MNNTDKLKPCPICSSAGEIHKPYGEHGTKFVSCSNKDCFMAECKVIADLWNTRANESEIEAKDKEIEALNIKHDKLGVYATKQARKIAQLERQLEQEREIQKQHGLMISAALRGEKLKCEPENSGRLDAVRAMRQELLTIKRIANSCSEEAVDLELTMNQIAVIAVDALQSKGGSDE